MASNEGSQDLLPKYAEKKIQKRRYEPETVDPGTKISRDSSYLEMELIGDETVEVGKDARLTGKSYIKTDLTKYKAAWQRFINHKTVNIDLTVDKYAGSTSCLGGPRTTTLCIKNVQMEDQGLYQLKLESKENRSNTAYIQKMLYVTSGPPVITISGNERVGHEERSVFTARISFNADISNYTAKWQKIEDGKVIDIVITTDKYAGSEDVPRKSKPLKLVINKVMMTDQGTYQLSVNRNGGNQTTCMQKLLYVDFNEEWKKDVQYNLLNKVATKALRSYFITIVPDSGLHNHLRQNENVLKKQCKQFEINQLYPGTGCVSSENFDTSLMYKVIRNTFSVPTPTNGWGKLPPKGTTETDDVERIRYHRNTKSHDGDLKDFEIKWKDLSGAIERLGGSAMKKEGDAFKKETFFESTDNARLSAIEDSITDIKEALKDGRMTAPSPKKEKPMVLVRFKCQRKCGMCDRQFQRPASPPNDVVFRQQVPRSFYADRERKLKFDKVHYHVSCVSADGNYNYIIDPDTFKGIIVSDQHLQFFNDYKFTQLVDMAKKHNASINRVAIN